MEPESKPPRDDRPYADFGEEAGYPKVRKRRKTFRVGDLSPFWGWICAGGLMAVLILMTFFPILRSTRNTQGMLALEARLSELETRLNVPNFPTAPLEARLDGLSRRLDRLEADLERTSPGGRRSAGDRVAPETPAAPKPAIPGFHVVAAGETLYGIARRYGVTVDELRRLNDLKPGALIQPGQNLRLSPP